MLGRKKSIEKNMPRTIDIDILVHGSVIMETKELIIPHPGLINRKFVLIPLNEIGPNLMHPKYNKTISELLINCKDIESVEEYAI